MNYSRQQPADEDLMVSIPQALHDFCGGLLPGKVQEELLDVLNLEGALLERVLLEEVFHGAITISDVAASLFGPTSTSFARRSRTGTRHPEPATRNPTERSRGTTRRSRALSRC